jgi:hypothetical protein
MAAALLAAAAAYAAYPEGAPPPSEVLGGLDLPVAEGPLSDVVAAALYTGGYVRVEGEPRPLEWPLVEVEEVLVLPRPGVWVAGGSRLMHMEVVAAVRGAEWLAAEGPAAYWYVEGVGRVLVVVAERLEAVVGGEEVVMEYAGHGHWGPMHGPPRHGAPQGPGGGR